MLGLINVIGMSPCNKLHKTSYQRTIVTVSMASLYGSHTTSYQSAIANTALSCNIFELFYAEKYRNLEIYVRVTQVHWIWHHSINRIRVPIRLPL